MAVLTLSFDSESQSMARILRFELAHGFGLYVGAYGEGHSRALALGFYCHEYACEHWLADE